MYPELTTENNQTLPLEQNVPSASSPRLNKTFQNQLPDSDKITRRVFHPNGEVENLKVSIDKSDDKVRNLSTSWNQNVKPQVVCTPISKRVAQYMNHRRKTTELDKDFTYLHETDSRMDTALTHLTQADNHINFRPIQDEPLQTWQTRKKDILDFSNKDLYKYSDVQEWMDTPVSQRTRSKMSNFTPDHHLVGD